MIRAHRLARPALHTAIRCQTAAATTTKTAVAPAVKTVKFQKEDVNDVMSELPAFNFYELKESVDNPYNMNTLDHSILLDPPVGAPAQGKVEYSVLENGLKVASIDRGGMSASLGLFVNAGSRFENSASFGLSHATALMAYKSSAHLSNLRTAKMLEHLGCQNTAVCTAGREDVVYSVNVMREFMPLVVPMLVGNVLFPRLLPWEVKTAEEGVALASANLAADADASVQDLLHRTAYCNNTLGNNTLATARTNFTPDAIRAYMLDHFAPERMCCQV
jgi:processing peptidase subunit alpha